MWISRVFTVVAFLAIALPASAAPLNLVLALEPDITSHLIDVDYTGGIFTASGMATTLKIDGGVYGFNPGGTFSLQAKINAAGELTDSISFEIRGGVDSYDPTLIGPIMLKGDIVDFGFGDAGPDPDPFEFLLTNSSGALASLYGSDFGVKLFTSGISNPAVGSLFEDDFLGNARSGTSNTRPIPEPTSGILALIGGFFVVRRVRRVIDAK
jgi:hypothetical protein